MSLWDIFKRGGPSISGPVVNAQEFGAMVALAGLPRTAIPDDDLYRPIEIATFWQIMTYVTAHHNFLPYRTGLADCDKRARLVLDLGQERYAELAWSAEPYATWAAGIVHLKRRGAKRTHKLIFNMGPGGVLTLYEDLAFKPVTLDVEKYLATYY